MKKFDTQVSNTEVADNASKKKRRRLLFLEILLGLILLCVAITYLNLL